MIELLIEATVLTIGGGFAGYEVGRLHERRLASIVVPTTTKCLHPAVRFDTHGQEHDRLKYYGYCTRCGAAFTEVLPIHDWASKENSKKHRTARIKLAMEARGWLCDDPDEEDSDVGTVYYR